MKLNEARDILAIPVFGDARCIEAKKVIERHEEEEELRKALVGHKTECWCCEGSGELRCKAGCCAKWAHVCPTCDGDEKLKLTAELLEDLSLEQLRDLRKEMQVTA